MPLVVISIIAFVVEIGVKLLSVEIRDLMLPGDLKRIFAQEVQARKEGLAALERARGERAALRSLANAARLVQDNPALLQLRLLQTE
jgi:regulator of protease activity HflC (stomatin/prohibitin superfamily)